MPSFQISPEAIRDLNEIIDYFLVSSLDAGDRFIAAFNQKCLYLTQFPNSWKAISQSSPQHQRNFLQPVHYFLPASSRRDHHFQSRQWTQRFVKAVQENRTNRTLLKERLISPFHPNTLIDKAKTPRKSA
jgi:plasmid stabilization system protein ParE